MVQPSRIAVVTGANKGIGYEIALQLGLSGLFSDIILGCRDAGRGTAAMYDIQGRIDSSAIHYTRVHFLPLTIGDVQSHSNFCKRLEDESGGAVDVLVNNAGFAYKASDPTPFQHQTAKTLGINFFGTIDFTLKMLPLLRRGNDSRIVNLAAMSGRLSQVSPSLQARFKNPQLTIDELNSLMYAFADAVRSGNHTEQGWSNSNYGISKLGIIAATKVLARDEAQYGISINSCCPGCCDTDMSSHRGRRSPADGARNAVMPATMEHPPTGEYFADYKVSRW